jgi:putative DNA primase/helicase
MERSNNSKAEYLGEFAQYIPGLLNWMLAMDKAVPKLAVMKAQTLVETNPIADWVDHNIVCREN